MSVYRISTPHSSILSYKVLGLVWSDSIVQQNIDVRGLSNSMAILREV